MKIPIDHRTGVEEGNRGMARPCRRVMASTLAKLVIVVGLCGGILVARGWGLRWSARAVGVSSTDGAGSLAYVAPREYFRKTASFSEVTTARGELAAVAERYLADIESRLGPMHGPRGAEGTASEAGVDRLVEALRRGIEEFAGTPQESTLRQHLLAVLRRWGRDEAWMGTYLDLAYRHPTDPLVGRLAAQAVRVAARLGRRFEVVDLLTGIARIPLEFEAKAAIRASLGPEMSGLPAEGAWEGTACL